MKGRFINTLLLMLTALIWGLAFVAQSSGSENIGAFTFNAIRSLIGAAVLLPLVISEMKKGRYPLKTTLWGGFLCGLCLFIASTLQQFGIEKGTGAGKAGFITSLYSVMVPLIRLITGKRTKLIIWISAVLSVTGLYLLCAGPSFSITGSDLLVLGCSLFFAFQILFIDSYSQKTSGILLSFIQLLTMCFMSSVPMFAAERPTIGQILPSWLPVVYTGIFSMGVAYTLQIIAQKDSDPTVASVILSLESVFAAVFGAIILKESMSLKEIAGCVLIFTAVILSQTAGARSESGEADAKDL